MLAVKESPHALQWVSEGMQSEPEVVFAAIYRVADAYSYADDIFLKDKNFALAVAGKAYGAFGNLDRSLQGDRDVVLEALNLNWDITDYLPQSLNDDDEVITKIIMSSRFHANWAMEFASDRIRNSKDIVLMAI